MLLPILSAVKNASKEYSVAFKGLNYGEGTQDGEFAETYNLSTDQYPSITQRATRMNVKSYAKPTTLHSKGQLLVIDEVTEGNANVYYGDNPEPIGTVTAGKKQTATIGNYIVIFPDKKYYKVPTEEDKDGEFGDMEAKVTVSGLKFTASTISSTINCKASWLAFTSSTITFCTEYKSARMTFEPASITKYSGAADFPFKAGDVVSIKGGTYTSNQKDAVTIKQATGNKLTFDSNIFTSVYDTVEVKITKIVKDGFPFKAGDAVTITGCSNSENNKATEVVVKEATANTLTFDDNSFVEGIDYGEVTISRKSKIEFPFRKGDAVTITGCSTDENNKKGEIIIKEATSDELTFDANTFTECVDDGEITITRAVPDLDFICESNYRLWGTHGNTIYSSKFSDPFNFKTFEGLASDSYYIDVGSEGEFTGCIPYSSHICFFKENTLHKLYGTKPSNFQVNTVNVYGVQSGSERSMQIVNEQLLYKGVGGVYAYTGGVPELISEKFGNKRYSDAVACCDGEKYYISMRQGEEWSLFAYDVAKNIWLREDDTQAVDMTFYDGKVYLIDGDGQLFYIDKTAERDDIEWSATLCTINETMNERKGYSKFHLRMDLSAGAWLAVDIKTDNERQWKQVYTTHNEKAKTVSIPIMPNRCDCIDIRLRGKGKCTIKTFIREFTVGSDV